MDKYVRFRNLKTILLLYSPKNNIVPGLGFIGIYIKKSNYKYSEISFVFHISQDYFFSRDRISSLPFQPFVHNI